MVDPDTGKVRRTGMTNDLKRTEQEHNRDSATTDLDLEVDRLSDSRSARRGREQRIYDQYSDAGLNRRNPIASNNPNRDQYLEAGDEL